MWKALNKEGIEFEALNVEGWVDEDEEAPPGE